MKKLLLISPVLFIIFGYSIFNSTNFRTTESKLIKTPYQSKTLVNSSLLLDLDTNDALLKKQKKIVSILSGHSFFKENIFIKSRSTKEQRQLTRAYLSSIILEMGLTPIIQEYRLPNVNPIVDLLFSPYKGANVYTILPATIKSDKYIVIGGHLDSERNCPGAIDNATGMAISYGVIKKLSDLEHRNTNFILAFFDQEEEDLVGSQAFAQLLLEKKYNVHSVHTLDTMGWDRDGDQAVELERPSEHLLDIYTEVGKKLGIEIYGTNVGSTDFVSFQDLGFNALGISDELVNGDYAPYKDTPKDVYDTVNFNYVNSSTELVYQVFIKLMQ